MKFVQPVYPVDPIPSLKWPVWSPRWPYPSSSFVNHFGIICNRCSKPIYGNRFKSLLRDDFDLCTSCVKRPEYTHEWFIVLARDERHDHSLQPGAYRKIINAFQRRDPYSWSFNPFVHYTEYHPFLGHFQTVFAGHDIRRLNNFLWDNEGCTMNDLHSKYATFQ